MKSLLGLKYCTLMGTICALPCSLFIRDCMQMLTGCNAFSRKQLLNHDQCCRAVSRSGSVPVEESPSLYFSYTFIFCAMVSDILVLDFLLIAFSLGLEITCQLWKSQHLVVFPLLVLRGMTCEFISLWVSQTFVMGRQFNQNNFSMKWRPFLTRLRNSFCSGMGPCLTHVPFTS